MKAEKDKDQEKKELKITVKAEWLKPKEGDIASFNCKVEHNLDLGPDTTWEGFVIHLPFIVKAWWKEKPEFDPHIARMYPHINMTFSEALDLDTPMKSEKSDSKLLLSGWLALQTYDLTEDEYKNLIDLFFPEINPKVNEYFGAILKKILDKTGYVVTIEIPDYYYSAPAQMGFVVPAFGTGLQKNIKPEEVTKADYPHDKTYIYLSYEKPKSKIQIQLDLLDNLPEERMEKIERALKENLTPYGLKTLYLILQGCAKNNRQNWMILDTNQALDSLGHKRDRRGIHYSKNRKKLIEVLEEHTRTNFNIENRMTLPGKKRKERVNKFYTPLISLNGKFETWEVDEGEPAETGKLVKDGIIIHFHPEIYKYIENKATTVPDAFLKINAKAKPHAILLYAYIFNQWRIGWHQYYGVIKQPMKQILDGAGLYKRLPKRKNQQRDFVNRIIADFKWLKSKPEFWIKSIRIETKNKPHLDYMVTVEMSDDHPFKGSMTRQIEKE